MQMEGYANENKSKAHMQTIPTTTMQLRREHVGRSSRKRNKGERRKERERKRKRQKEKEREVEREKGE